MPPTALSFRPIHVRWKSVRTAAKVHTRRHTATRTCRVGVGSVVLLVLVAPEVKVGLDVVLRAVNITS